MRRSCWALLVVFPYFGSAIFVLLSIWTLLGVVIGIDAITTVSRWEAFESAAIGWDCGAAVCKKRWASLLPH